MEKYVRKMCHTCKYKYYAINNSETKCPRCKLHNTETIEIQKV